MTDLTKSTPPADQTRGIAEAEIAICHGLLLLVGCLAKRGDADDSESVFCAGQLGLWCWRLMEAERARRAKEEG